jgi:hypothetical protein
MRGLALKGFLLQLGNDYPYYIYAKLQREGKITSRPHLGQAYEDVYDIRKWCLYLEPLTIPRIPREWRKTFGDESLPVGLITPPGSDLVTHGHRHHCECASCNGKRLKRRTGVDLILPGTEHVPFSAQPADEALLGARCLAWLTGAVYKKMAAWPRARSSIAWRKWTIRRHGYLFKPGTANGLKAGRARWTISKSPASIWNILRQKATLDGDAIRLSSGTVETIAYVRYNWSGKPDQGLTAWQRACQPSHSTRMDTCTPGRSKYAMGEEELPPEFSTPITEWDTDGPVVYKWQTEREADDGANIWDRPVFG